jgi:hypothetical protein
MTVSLEWGAKPLRFRREEPRGAEARTRKFNVFAVLGLAAAFKGLRVEFSRSLSMAR